MYLPPRLTHSEIAHVLAQSVSKVTDIVFGDINVRFGAEFRDTQRVDVPRGDFLISKLGKLGLGLRLCWSGCSKNDHLFGKFCNRDT